MINQILMLLEYEGWMFLEDVTYKGFDIKLLKDNEKKFSDVLTSPLKEYSTYHFDDVVLLLTGHPDLHLFKSMRNVIINSLRGKSNNRVKVNNSEYKILIEFMDKHGFKRIPRRLLTEGMVENMYIMISHYEMFNVSNPTMEGCEFLNKLYFGITRTIQIINIKG